MPATFDPPGKCDLRSWLDLQSRALTPSGTDTATETYTTVARVPARIRAIFGGRVIDNIQDQARATHVIVIRYRSDQSAWRWLLYDGRRFRVHTIMDPDERRMWLELLAEEVERGL